MRLSTYLGGVLILAAGLCLFLVNLTSPADMVWPREPVLGLSMQGPFWALGIVAVSVSLVCLFDRLREWQPFLIAWCGTNLLVYQFELYREGCRGLAGYMGGFSQAFDISAGTADVLLILITVSLLVIGYGSLVWLWQNRKLDKNLVKMSCPACGGHVKFAPARIGENIPCPHCATAVVLRKPENVKISCYFCKEHMEFPSHALGTKISCPHCKKGITLQLGLEESKAAG